MTRAKYSSGYDDLDELRRRFEEFRGKHRVRARLPEELWRGAAEMATQRGMNITARSLRLDTNSVKKWMGARAPAWLSRNERGGSLRQCRRRLSWN